MVTKPIEVSMFGGLSLQVQGRRIERFRTRKTAILLACLAYHPGRAFRREEIIEMLWPYSEPDSGRQSLSTTLTALRRQMEPSGIDPGSVICADRHSIRLAPDAITTDVQEFRRASERAQAARGPTEQAKHLRRALSLYSGPLLPGFDETWVLLERERLQEEHALGLERQAELLEQNGALHEAIPLAERALDAAPYCERHYLLLARLHAIYGDRKAAGRVLDQLDHMLKTDLGEPPSGSAKVLRTQFEDLAASGGGHGTSSSLPPPPAENTGPPVIEHSLPYFPSRFFGREQEMQSLVQALETSRLVTITGLGGMGKTRLAVEVLRSFVAGGTEGWFVDLAPVAQYQDVSAAVARELGLPPSAAASFAQFAERLHGRPSLVVLDNFEHVLPAARWVEDLLAHVPGLKVLATSRVRLGLPCEWELLLEPLPLPDQRSKLSQVLACPSVALFVDRAQHARGDFQITDRNLPPLLELCNGLEGIPLALELAASRALVMTPFQMVDQMRDRFTFLVNKRRPAVERHRTMELSLQWGYDLLSEGARACFGCLAVFRGGWSLAAATAVLGDPKAVDWLEELVSTCMVRVSDSDGEIRFGLLESMRAFAVERLDPSVSQTLRDRHLDFFLQFAEEHAPLLRGPEQAIYLKAVAQEQENIADALAYAKDARPVDGLRLAIAASAFWEVSANTASSRRWLGEYLSLPFEYPPELLIHALYALGNLRVFAGEFAAAKEALQLCVEKARQLGQPELLANALESLSLTLANMRDRDTGQIIDEGHRLAIALSDRALQARMYVSSAVHHAYEGRMYEAVQVVNEGLALAEELNIPFLKGRLTLCHGSSYLALRRFDDAKSRYEEAMDLAQKVGDAFVVCVATWGLSLTESELGRAREAWNLWLEHYQMLRTSGMMWGMPHLLESASRFEWKDKQFRSAVTLFAAAHGMRNRMQAPYPFGTGHYYGDLNDRIEEVRHTSPFIEAWGKGLGMDWEEAAEFAIRTRSEREEREALAAERKAFGGRRGASLL